MTVATNESVRVATVPKSPLAGAFIVNADDWGCDVATTDAIRACFDQNVMSSASAMVFMEDSERAAQIARERKIDTGLHLNLDTPFTARSCPARLLEHQRKIAAFVRHPLARPLFHPGVRHSFEYVVSEQLNEYERLYGSSPRRIDGHHHMHLCANVLFANLLPEGVILRPHFAFQAGEKRVRNGIFRLYAKWALTKRYATVDHLYSLPPMESKRLSQIASLAASSFVELETHPAKPVEFRFLTEGGLYQMLGETPVAPSYVVRGLPSGL